MAKQLTPKKKGNGSAPPRPPADSQPEGPTTGHNLAHINGAITKGFKKIFELETMIADLTEQHLASVKKERTVTWRNLKTDTNIERTDLELDYKKYKRARIARDEMEPEEGERVLDNMKIVHEALYPGETVDMIDVLARIDAEVAGS